MTPQHITDADFAQQVLKSSQPVLVDFWAEWCQPCKSIAPILEELASEYGERLSIVKVDVDSNQDAPAKYGIRSIPTLMLFKGGEIAGTLVGAVPKVKLRSFIDSHL